MGDQLDVGSLLEAAQSAAGAGDLTTADASLRRALALQESALGRSHPDLASTLNNLAIIAERTGQLKDAEVFYRRAARIAAESLPPEDPLVALARARRELEVGPSIPEIRLGRALERLSDFRAETEYRSLEALLQGSTRAWFDFYLERDPQAANALVAAELEKEPAALDLWHMLGESQAALGQKSSAVETFRFLLRMLPNERTTRALARLLSESGRDTDEVSELVGQTMHLERSRGRDIDLQLSVARSLANNLAAESRDRALSMLQELWNKRSHGRGDDAQVAEIGELYGLCLVWRHQPENGLAQEVLLEVEELVDDPARRHLLRAVANLAP